MREASDGIYLIAMGSNRRHHRIGPPERVLEAAMEALAAEDVDILALAPAIHTRPIGPSSRTYANSAALIRTGLAPDDLLLLLKAIEARFGRRRGQRWSARTLDLDIILWSGGAWRTRRPDLMIPHPRYPDRSFVLQPAARIARHLRHPASGRTIAHLLHRATRG
jgi:2-amino-4-hydroxy-6-hydroxymethyldihydropteridine diphosphokinase